MTLPQIILRKLTATARMSRAAARLAWLLPMICFIHWPLVLEAHETRPAVADMQVSAVDVSLEITLSLEAPLAGIDLDGLEDTNDAPQSEEYDALRKLPPGELEIMLRSAWPSLSKFLHLESNSEELDLILDDAAIPDVGDPDLPRDSVLTLSAVLPPGTDPVTFSWDRELGPIFLRQVADTPDAYAAFLNGGEESAPFPRAGEAVSESKLASFARYVKVGFEHIIPKGMDHILFVLGLFFYSTRLGPLLWQVTAFTAAHTVTLALATFGVVNVSPSIVEPLIALSIAYVGFENVIARRMTPLRPALVFAFGLLHGLGFASVLGDVGLSSGHAAVSLIAFNIGVEIGQLAVIAAAYALVGFWFSNRPWYRARIAIPASILIGLTGFYWFLERVELIPV